MVLVRMSEQECPQRACRDLASEGVCDGHAPVVTPAVHQHRAAVGRHDENRLSSSHVERLHLEVGTKPLLAGRSWRDHPGVPGSHLVERALVHATSPRGGMARPRMKLTNRHFHPGMSLIVVKLEHVHQTSLLRSLPYPARGWISRSRPVGVEGEVAWVKLKR